MRRTQALLVLVAAVLLTMSLLASPAYANAGTARDQRRLNELGCQAGPADGIYGEWTRAAVMRFQSRHGYAVTGYLNATTRTRLYSSTARRCDRRPVPASGTGRRIVLSQAQNWVWLVRHDGSVLAQGGIIDNPGELAKGWRKVAAYCGRAAKIRTNYSSGGLRLENFTRFSPCGIGFHRIPQYSNGAQIHSDHLLGTNLRQSHGCVRASAAMSRLIWDFGVIGTPVRVI